MPHNTAIDSIQYVKLDLPYNRIETELSPMPRIISGYNTYITTGGKLCKAPGTINLPNSLKTGYRIDRLWNYETLETPAKVYIMASMQNLSTNMWEMWYYRPSAINPLWTQIGTYRQINNSTQPHEANVFKGLFYIKGFPSAASGEKLGTVLFNGSGNIPVTEPWGILPPTVPAALVGAITFLSTNIGSGDTSFSALAQGTGGFPNPPFNIQIDFELLTVTSIVGTTWNVTRGVNGTTAAAHNSESIIIWRNWANSGHLVTVNIGWGYTYAYKSVTGQYSNRAPLQTNPDSIPSRTGPFQNLIPAFNIQGSADTANLPKIGIFRTTDGGGTFYFIEDINNTGAGNILYQDTNFHSNLGNVDPVPDEILNTGIIAPTLTSNSPPPAVISPQVTGVDTPVQSSPIVSYAARQWYCIGNILFFSGNEEVSLGIPEECFPSGTFGNFYRLANPGLNVQPTSNYLYVFTNKNIEQLSGTNLETFNLRPNFDNIGVPYSNPRATTRFAENIAFLTQDLRVGIITNGNIEIISDPLSTDLSDGANLSNLEYDLKYFADNEKELLFVSGHSKTDSTLSRQWLYDIKKSNILGEIFWQTPWQKRISATYSDRIYENSTQRKFVVAHFNPASGGSTNLAYIDMSLTTPTDSFLNVATGYTFDLKTHLMTVPYGNHVNLRREPFVTPVIYAVSLDRILFLGGNDTDPIINYYLDDIWTQPIQGFQYEDPARRKKSLGYKTIVLPIDKVAQRVAVEITKNANFERFEAQNLIVSFGSDLGA